MNSYRCCWPNVRSHLEAGRLTEGVVGNAYDCYQEVLALDSGNVMALSGLKAIEDQYIEWVHRDMESGDLAGAGRFSEEGTRVESGAGGIDRVGAIAGAGAGRWKGGERGCIATGGMCGTSGG